MFDIKDYDYHLPPDLIAQAPVRDRDRSRLLVVYRYGGRWEDRLFFELPSLLRHGDLLVVNDSKVIPARLYGNKETGGKIEVLILSGRGNVRECLLKSSKRPKKGSLILFEGDLVGKVEELLGDGRVSIRFEYDGNLDQYLEKKGHVPLPPYIKRRRDDPLYEMDRERYQTIFAKEGGSIAAPTAGLHFSEGLLKNIMDIGARIAYVTLHVGWGTFRPVRTKDIRRHEIGEEYFRIPSKTAEMINETKEKGARVIAVGTTVVRALESVAMKQNQGISEEEGYTNLLIHPGFRFRVVDALITNFHLPRSSLLFLVAAFAGLDLIKKAYAYAIQKRYRFYSYGDAMFIQ